MKKAFSREEFDEILGSLLEQLPDFVKLELEEVPVIVEDEPEEEFLRELGDYEEGVESDLCGLHAGIPLSDRSSLYAYPNPPVIYLFRGPITRLAEGSTKKLKREIRITLLHEIGHYFGYTEEKLEAMGYG